MKVLVEGVRRPELWEGRWECLKCKRVVELDRGDHEYVVAVQDDQCEGLDVTIITMDCPVCGEETKWQRFKGKLPSDPVGPYPHSVLPVKPPDYPPGVRGLDQLDDIGGQDE